MTIDEPTIRELCTDAVFERGERYRVEGRIRSVSRVGDTVTATVQGSSAYDLEIDLGADEFDPTCSCPYSGPGECKHVVAVLLELADGLPADEGERIDEILADLERDGLQEFVRDELARDPEIRERFYAQFGESSSKSVADYREEVDRLFDEHTEEYPVVTEAIDFSRFTDLAERYRGRGNHRQAAAIYRALAVGIDENMRLVDAAYDHYSQAFTSALDEYVDCISEVDRDEQESAIEFLADRATQGTDYLREHYDTALEELRTRTDET